MPVTDSLWRKETFLLFPFKRENRSYDFFPEQIAFLSEV